MVAKAGQQETGTVFRASWLSFNAGEVNKPHRLKAAGEVGAPGPGSPQCNRYFWDEPGFCTLGDYP